MFRLNHLWAKMLINFFIYTTLFTFLHRILVLQQAIQSYFVLKVQDMRRPQVNYFSIFDIPFLQCFAVIHIFTKSLLLQAYSGVHSVCCHLKEFSLITFTQVGAFRKSLQVTGFQKSFSLPNPLEMRQIAGFSMR